MVSESRNQDVIDALLGGPTPVILTHFPFRIVGEAGDNAHIVPPGSHTLGEASCVGCIARRFGCVVESENHNVELGFVHRCNNSGRTGAVDVRGVTMDQTSSGMRSTSNMRVLDLSMAPGERLAWDRPPAVIYLWAIFELLFIYNPWQISSSLRVKILRLFGAEIGSGVIFRPRTRVKFPWKLHIADRCWIGEGVWLHNQDHIFVGADAVISQEAFLTTGSHAVRKDMGLITSPITVHAGAWITARCVVLGGASIGTSAIVTPNTVVRTGTVIPDGAVFGQPDAEVVGNRFSTKSQPQSKGDV